MTDDIYELKIAKITKTFLGTEDHGIFTFNINLDYGSGGQGFGGICLANPRHQDEGVTAAFITRILSACNVDCWEKLVGRTVYAIVEKKERLVRGLAPLPTEHGDGFTFTDAGFAAYLVAT